MSLLIDMTSEFDRLKSELREEILAEIRAQDDGDRWPGWMDIQAASRYLGHDTEERLRKLVARRAIPFSQEGPRCRVFFEKTALDAHMRSQAGGA